MSFENNVFINCPFDKDFQPMLKSLVFSLLYLDFEPRLSQTLSSSEIRIHQIITHISNSKFGIHDLSRNKAKKKGELPRFNMPYELGLDIGAARFGSGELKSKRILILETKRYEYQKFISDISGQDIENHDNDPLTLITKVRNWFINLQPNTLSSASLIWKAYNQFTGDLYIDLKDGFSDAEIIDMPIAEYIKYARPWITKFKVGR